MIVTISWDQAMSPREDVEAIIKRVCLEVARVY